jgi:phosphonate transport system substrate-binding protein
MATADGVSTYQMEIIVPADSPIKTLDDLKGHELVLTDPGSNSGFKAPLVLLSKDNGLLPGRDFTIRYSGEQEHSIKGIATKQYQAAAVANDVLKRALAVGDIQKEQYRSIYKSENFPTAGFGYVYNLKPDLAAKVKAALLSFPWKGTGMEKEFEPGGQAKFVPVDFKNDWALVRRIDDAIRSIEKLENLATTMPTEAPKSPATRPQ